MVHSKNCWNNRWNAMRPIWIVCRRLDSSLDSVSNEWGFHCLEINTISLLRVLRRKNFPFFYCFVEIAYCENINYLWLRRCLNLAYRPWRTKNVSVGNLWSTQFGTREHTGDTVTNRWYHAPLASNKNENHNSRTHWKRLWVRIVQACASYNVLQA